VLTLVAVQDPNDGSVWSVTIPYTSTPQTGNVQFKIIEGAVSRTFNVLQMLVVEYPCADGSDSPLPDNTFFF
jgi:hypothetical protein